MPNFPETLPNGWQDRMVPFRNHSKVFALHPLDLVLVKLLIGREKDLALVRQLLRLELITFSEIRLHFQRATDGEREMTKIGIRLNELDQEFKI